LSGQERGASTDARQQKRGLFEQGDGGTVFLDEVASTPLADQARLLGLVEGADARVIASSNANVLARVADGSFRQDLYFRLAGVVVTVPPLDLAARRIGNEPEPAAGAIRSSGGNFAVPVGSIQDAYAIGDLLPYTELKFPEPRVREIFPGIDRKPNGQLGIDPWLRPSSLPNVFAIGDLVATGEGMTVVSASRHAPWLAKTIRKLAQGRALESLPSYKPWRVPPILVPLAPIGLLVGVAWLVSIYGEPWLRGMIKAAAGGGRAPPVEAASEPPASGWFAGWSSSACGCPPGPPVGPQGVSEGGPGA